MSVLEPVIDRVDIATKRIHLLQGVSEYHPVEDIYKEVRQLRKVDESLRVVDMPVSAFGNIPKGGGKYTPRYLQFNHGWRLVPFDESSTLYISGEQITDEGTSGPACLDMSSLVNPVVIHYEPPSSEIVRDEVSLAAIAFMSFNNEVWHDHILGTTKAEHTALGRDPNLLGNSQYPASSHIETVEIANDKQLRHIRYTGNHSNGTALLTNVDLSNFNLHGDNPMSDILELGPLPQVTGVEFANLTIFGELDEGCLLRECMIDGLAYFNGMIHSCALSSEPIIIGGTKPAFFMECYGYPSLEAPSVIDSNGSESDIIMRDYEGGLLIKNVTSPETFITITFRGKVIIDESCTAGTWNLSGTGDVINNSALEIETHRVLQPGEIANQVWNDSRAVVLQDDAAKSRKSQLNKAIISGDDRLVTIYDDDGTTILHQFDVSADKKTRVPV